MARGAGLFRQFQYLTVPLTITPELVDAVSERAALYYQQGRRR